MESEVLKFKFHPRKVVTWLFGISVALIIVSTLLYFLKYQFNISKTIFVEFYLDEENNFPTYFSTFLLLFSSIFLWVIGKYHKNMGWKYHNYWYGLSIVFLILSLDEMIGLHESANYYVKQWLNPTGLFYFGWIIPAFAFVVILTIVYLRFFLQLPRKTKIHFFVAAALYISGVIGLEAVGGNFLESFGRDNLTYALITTIEETLELAGLNMFIYALLANMRDNKFRIMID